MRINTLRSYLILALIITEFGSGAFALAFDPAQVINSSGRDANALVCNVLNIIGMSCGATPPIPNIYNQSATISSLYNNNPTPTPSPTPSSVYSSTSRAKLLQVEGSKDIYYLTEANMTRLIPNDDILNSYGDNKNTIIAISQETFNSYPANQYIFFENQSNKNVFYISGNIKRYVTSMALRKLRIQDYEIAPVNQKEFDYYQAGDPIVM